MSHDRLYRYFPFQDPHHHKCDNIQLSDLEPDHGRGQACYLVTMSSHGTFGRKGGELKYFLFEMVRD